MSESDAPAVTDSEAAGDESLADLFGGPDASESVAPVHGPVEVAEPRDVDSLADLFGPGAAPANAAEPAPAPEAVSTELAPSEAVASAEAAGWPQADVPASSPRDEPAARPQEGELTAAELAELEKVTAAVRSTARFTRQNDLYRYVDAIMLLIQQDPKLQKMRRESLRITQDAADSRVQMRLLQDAVSAQMVNAGVPVPSPKDVPLVFEMVYDELLGLGPMGPFFRDPEVTEIMVDAWDKIVVERNGHLLVTPARFRDLEHGQSIARNMSELVSDRRVSPAHPIVTAELPDSRVQFNYGPIVASGLSITLRKFRALHDMAALMRFGSLTSDMAEFLAACVRARANILVSGGTGTGKTTVINALSSYIPHSERVVTIENAYELKLSNTHWVPLRTKEASSADTDADARVTQSDLLISSLRMRPDRIIVGEIREPAEATVMLTAANTGHDGTCCTIHANSAAGAVRRLASLARIDTGMTDDLAALEVATAVDLIVQVTRRAGKRYISDIAVVDETCLAGNTCVPQSLFQGDLQPDGHVMFRPSGALRADTALARKLIDTGADIARWE